MTSRERIIASLNHEKTDRVAIDIGSNNATGINAIAYKNLKDLLGIKGTTKVYSIIDQLVEVEPDVLDRLGGDVVLLRRYAPSLGIPVRGFKKGKLTDGSDALVADSYNPVLKDNGDMELMKITDGTDQVHPYPRYEPVDQFDKGKTVAVCRKGTNAFFRVYHPLENRVSTIEELDRYEFPVLCDEEAAFLAEESKRLYETTDKAICGVFGGNIFEMPQLFLGYENTLVYMATEPEFMHHFYKRKTDAFMIDLERYMKAAGRYIQAILFFDDLGSQSSLLMSPAMYRDMIKPHAARMIEFVRKNYPDVNVLMHSCGAVYELIPDLIEIGVQTLNPVQISARGMDPARLKKEFGKHLAFWGGGVDTQKTLNQGTVEEVRKEAREMLDIFTPGSGYVFSQVHNIVSSVPAQNILAAFETAKNYRLSF
jgi:uroporphyrinogen decarboxylase